MGRGTASAIRSVAQTAILLLTLVSGLCLSPRPASATSIVLSGFTADMQTSIDPPTGNRIISLLVNSNFFGPSGIAGGLVTVGPAPAAAGIWLVDAFVPPIDDGTPALGFLLNPGGEVMGIEPSPFRIFLASGPAATLIGELDFSAVTGSQGSLNLSGVVVHEVDAVGDRTGVFLNVTPSTLTQVPEPSTFLLLLSSLSGLVCFRRRSRR